MRSPPPPLPRGEQLLLVTRASTALGCIYNMLFLLLFSVAKSCQVVYDHLSEKLVIQLLSPTPPPQKVIECDFRCL